MKFLNKNTGKKISYDGTSADKQSGWFIASEYLGRSKKTGKLVYIKHQFRSAESTKQFIADFLGCDIASLNQYKVKAF